MVDKIKTVVEEIMEKSGNSFHSRVVSFIREQKWDTLVSPYYSDNFTDKPREIDIIAGRKFDVYNFTSWAGTVDVHLFIECKYINGDTVFWFDDKYKNRAIERIMTDTGMKHPQDNMDTSKHHYLTDTSVAKLFSSEKSRNEDNELINKAINQSLNAMVYYRNRKDIIPEKSGVRNQTLKQIAYPLIVVNSFDCFYRTNMSDKDEKIEPITKPFQLEINYAYLDKDKKSCSEYFLIDVVSIDMLPDFLLMLENNDVSLIKGKVAWEAMENNNRRERNTGLGNNSSR